MSWRIDPALFCSVPSCTRPKQAGESLCVPCLRLERFASGLGLGVVDSPGCELPALTERDVLAHRDPAFDRELNAWRRT